METSHGLHPHQRRRKEGVSRSSQSSSHLPGRSPLIRLSNPGLFNSRLLASRLSDHSQRNLKCSMFVPLSDRSSFVNQLLGREQPNLGKDRRELPTQNQHRGHSLGRLQYKGQPIIAVRGRHCQLGEEELTEGFRRRLVSQIRREGWQRPPRKLTALRRSPRDTCIGYLGDNRYAVLATLTCSQRKELDRTGTLRMPRPIPSAPKKMPAKSHKKQRRHRRWHQSQPAVQVCTTTIVPQPQTEEAQDERIRALPHEKSIFYTGVTTRARAHAAPQPFVYTALPDARRRVIRRVNTVRPASVASAYLPGLKEAPVQP